MWNRVSLKEQAKYQLKTKYWMAFLVSLIMGILAGNSGSGVSGPFWGQFPPGQAQFYRNNFSFNGDWQSTWNSFFASGLFQLILAIVIVIVFLAIAYQIFVAGPIKVGAMRWFSRSRESAASPSITEIFSQFRRDRYMGAVGGMLWRDLWLFIWSTISALPIAGAFVVFFIGNNLFETMAGPGRQYIISFGRAGGVIGLIALVVGILLSAALTIIVIAKRYSYHLVPWLLADNAQLGAKRALTLSKRLTRGHRFEMFILDLSFIGWYILGFLACCIGMIFVTPYYYATHTELYAALRDIGAGKGIVAMEELGYNLVVPAVED